MMMSAPARITCAALPSGKKNRRSYQIRWRGLLTSARVAYLPSRKFLIDAQSLQPNLSAFLIKMLNPLVGNWDAGMRGLFTQTEGSLEDTQALEVKRQGLTVLTNQLKSRLRATPRQRGPLITQLRAFPLNVTRSEGLL
ncbi:unnamed protein product [Arctogadus glacialis]